MAATKWLQERWADLLPRLQSLTVEQEGEIAELCHDEIEVWKGRGISDSALRGPMTATRNEIKKLPTDPSHVWMNPRTQKLEHIALKHMNFSIEEWAAMNAPSQEKLQERLEDVKYLASPDAIVEKAIALLKSEHWYDLGAALAVLIGRRCDELLTAGELTPKTLYSVMFRGQLKRRDKVMRPYEIPTLARADLVLDAFARLRTLTAGYDGRLVSDSAQRHFSTFVPSRKGGDLYTHLFRSVYGAIAVFYYAPDNVLPIKYLNAIYGHYWVDESTGKLKEDYTATMHYQDYAIGNAVIAAHAGKRQGVKLDDPGVQVLAVFEKEVTTMTEEKKSEVVQATEKTSQTGFSAIKPRQETKNILDVIIAEENITASSRYDVLLRLLIKEHYELKQLKTLGVDGGKLAGLLAEVVKESNDPLSYLGDLLQSKRQFKESYIGRHANKDYSNMSLTQLTNTKTPEAANERFRRAVDAIMDYNDNQAQVVEQKWYINAKMVTDLVGGQPPLAAKYLEGRQEELDVHHAKHQLTSAYNRHPTTIIYRVAVPERPGEPADLQAQIARYEEKQKKKQKNEKKQESEESQ